MIHPETHLVRPDHGPCPAGPSDQCFYCKSAVGENHKSDCVMRARTVVLRAIIEYVSDEVEDWGEDSILFRRNDGSWCASNLIHELQKLARNNGDFCLCSNVRYEFVREATAADDKWGLKTDLSMRYARLPVQTPEQIHEAIVACQAELDRLHKLLASKQLGITD